jgi:hypothetical protein
MNIFKEKLYFSSFYEQSKTGYATILDKKIKLIPGILLYEKGIINIDNIILDSNYVNLINEQIKLYNKLYHINERNNKID